MFVRQLASPPLPTELTSVDYTGRRCAAHDAVVGGMAAAVGRHKTCVATLPRRAVSVQHRTRGDSRGGPAALKLYRRRLPILSSPVTPVARPETPRHTALSHQLTTSDAEVHLISPPE